MASFQAIVEACRLCLNTIHNRSHAVSLFSQTGKKQHLPDRIHNLLDVPVEQNDSKPQHICERCKRKVEGLEKAMEDLSVFTPTIRYTPKEREEWP